MDLGLYPLKYPFRKMISFVLPLMKDVSPDTVSWSMLPVGLATAACLWLAVAGGSRWWFLAVLGLLFVRMVIGTLDGLLATHFGKATPLGTIVNRLSPEICDVMYTMALVAARPDLRLLGVAALGLAWITSFAGIVGAAGGFQVQPVGPAGQTDRVAALELACFLSFLGLTFGWRVDFMAVFLWFVVAGSVPTLFIRVYRHYRAARVSPGEIRAA